MLCRAENLKEMGQELGRHADAGVRHHDLVFGKIPLVDLGHMQTDGTALGGELESVGK